MDYKGEKDVWIKKYVLVPTKRRRLAAPAWKYPLSPSLRGVLMTS